jgi:hypothetical protein
MISVYNYVNSHSDTKLSLNDVWLYFKSLYDLESLDELNESSEDEDLTDVKTLSSKYSEFSLPKRQFQSEMRKDEVDKTSQISNPQSSNQISSNLISSRKNRNDLTHQSNSRKRARVTTAPSSPETPSIDTLITETETGSDIKTKKMDVRSDSRRRVSSKTNLSSTTTISYPPSDTKVHTLPARKISDTHRSRNKKISRR